MTILFQDELEQLKKVRSVAKNLEEAEKLAVCLNQWGDDDSWGGSFGFTDWTAEKINNNWFINMKMIEQLIVDEGGIFQGYISFDNHLEDADAGYVPLLGVCPKAQSKGYGKALLLSVLKKTVELGKRRLELDTWAGNLRSVPVYKKTGFFWRKNTSAIMENYLPAVLGTPYFEDFFSKNDFYNTRELKIIQEPDDFIHETMQAYCYRFIENELNNLTVYVDCHAKDLSGFSYTENGKTLSVQLIPNQHEIFLGIDKPELEIQVINQRDYPVHIRGNITGYMEIKDLSTKEVDFIVSPGEEKSVKIAVSLSPSAETYAPRQEPNKRTNCRISAHLEIDNKICQLGCGWVPRDVFQIKLLKRSLYFGKNTEEILVPVGFRNLTQDTIDGSLLITGDGLLKPYLLDFTLKAESALEASIPIKRPVNSLSESWKWNLEFKVKRNSSFQMLPLISFHISCFTKTGAIAYINSKPEKEAVIENEFLRLHFSMTPANWYSLRTIFDKKMDINLSILIFGISVGRPFPADSSEFILIRSPFEVVQRENGIALKQEFISKIEKPGLKVVRWIELDAGKKFVTTYYDLTNTNENDDQVLTNVSVRNQFWRWRSLIRDITIPGKQGFIVADDPEFLDEYDYPSKPEDFQEPWLACEPQNTQELGLGFGVIWDPLEVERILITPEWGPSVEMISYDLKPGQTVRTGHYTLVVGHPAVRLTRKIWLEEFDGKATLNRERKHPGLSQKLMDFKIGHDISLPDSNQSPFPSISFIDLDSDKIEFRAQYLVKRQTPIDIQVSLSSGLWPESKEIKFKLEEGKLSNILLPYSKTNNNQEPYVIPFKGTISLPLNIRNHNWIAVPYHSKSQITLEKSEHHWVFSNKLMQFKTSNSHGASLFSANVGDTEELFFSRFPNKESFVWFSNFVGGFCPIAFIPGTNLESPFFTNLWSEPQLTKKDDWVGLQFSLASATNDIRLKDMSYSMTYYMKPRSPLLWGSFSFTNNSRMTNTIEAGLNLYLQPIKYIYNPWNYDFFIGKHTGKRRGVYTIIPHNWVILDWGQNRVKALFASANPQLNIRGEYSNQNNYSELYSHGFFTLAPGETRKHDTILIFSKDIDKLKMFQQRQEVVRL
ncbi:MAG: GNAT family N-acetyltransferase [Promethearchaeota archaeon]